MKFRFLNKTIEHQRFQYRPMYYDERKERLEQKKTHYSDKSKDLKDTERSEILRDNIKEGWSRAQYRDSQRRTSNLRITILVVVILGLGYFIFNGVDEVDTVVTKLW